MTKTPNELIRGDIFIFKNQEVVAIDIWINGYIWVTVPRYYIRDGINKAYGYTSAGIEYMDECDEFKVIGNMEEMN